MRITGVDLFIDGHVLSARHDPDTVTFLVDLASGEVVTINIGELWTINAAAEKAGFQLLRE